MKPSQQLVLLATLVLGSLSLPAAAQPSPTPPAKGAQPGAAERLKQAKELRKEAREAREHGRPGREPPPGAKNGPNAPAAEQADPASSGQAPAEPEAAKRGRFRGAMRAMLDDLRDGKLKKEAVKNRLMELSKDREARQKAHREAIRERWGQKLANPTAIEEVRHHERRMAQLDRIALLAQTERTGQAQQKVLDRVEKLTALENERHERAMAALQPTPAATDKPAAAAEDKQEAEEESDEVDENENEESPSGGAE